MSDMALCYKGIKKGMQADNSIFARWALEHFILDYPDFLEAYFDLAHLYIRLKDQAKAEQLYQKALNRWPTNAVLKKKMADFYYHEVRDETKALLIYEELVQSADFDLQTFLNTAHLYVSSERFDEAIHLYQRILKIDPMQADAKHHLEKVTQRHRKDQAGVSDDLYRQSMEFVKNGENDKAIRTLETLIRQSPDHANALNDLGVLYYQAGEKNKSLSFYEKAVSLEPENVNFLKNLGDYYFIEMNQAQKSLDIYVRLLHANPEDVEVLLNIGMIVKALDQRDDAAIFFEKVLVLEPNNKVAKKQLELLSQPPDLPTDQQVSSLTEQENKDHPEIRSLRERIAKNPQDASGHNDIGVLLYKEGRKEEALSHYEKAVLLDADNVVFRKNLADYYFMELGRVHDAIKIYHGILEKTPEDIETLMNLGLICLSLSLPEDAKTFFERVMEIEPWNIEGQNALDRTLELLAEKKNNPGGSPPASNLSL